MAGMSLRFVLLIGLFGLNACTTYIYQGRITAKDSAQTEREVILAWSKTEPLLGEARADMLVLQTGCGVAVNYDEKETGIYFFGVPGSDIPIKPELAQGNTVMCGQVLGHQRVEDIGAGKLSVQVLCKPKAGRFVGDKRRYLAAREAPYEFDISMTGTWSFLGSEVVLPQPVCTEP